MKKAALLMTMALLAAAALGAQASSGGQSSGAARPPSPAIGPGEPEIVMPQVILQIEDLSVEKVEAQLPPESELLPPDRAIPVLSEGDLSIGEPSISAPGIDEPGLAQNRDRLLTSQINLGAGSQNNIEGSIAIKTAGQDPRFALSFNHETLDGFSGHAPGSGYNLRNDDLNGDLEFRMGSVDTNLSGSFLENETGLQGQSPFASRLGRTLSGNVGFSATPLDWLTLSAAVQGGMDSLTLEGLAPTTLSGAKVSPTLSAEARFGVVKVGLNALYAYRSDPATDLSPASTLHRFQASTNLGVDLPANFILEGSFGWSWNSTELSRFLFSLTLTGTPLDFLTVSLGAGRRVIPYDMHDLLDVNPLVLPTSLVDDTQWFGNTSLQLTLARELAATLTVSYAASEAMPIGSTTEDPGSGLFPVTQVPGMRLTSNLGARWGISQVFSLSAGWSHEYLDRPFFTPLDSINVELLALEPAGRLGGSFSLLIAPTANGILQQPVVRLSGFWKISDAVKLQVDANDLLAPLMGAPRWDIQPYVAPGFRVAGSLGISL
jgi:hypothetical protein